MFARIWKIVVLINYLIHIKRNININGQQSQFRQSLRQKKDKIWKFAHKVLINKNKIQILKHASWIVGSLIGLQICHTLRWSLWHSLMNSNYQKEIKTIKKIKMTSMKKCSKLSHWTRKFFNNKHSSPFSIIRKRRRSHSGFKQMKETNKETSRWTKNKFSDLRRKKCLLMTSLSLWKRRKNLLHNSRNSTSKQRNWRGSRGKVRQDGLNLKLCQCQIFPAHSKVWQQSLLLGDPQFWNHLISKLRVGREKNKKSKKLNNSKQEKCQIIAKFRKEKDSQHQ